MSSNDASSSGIESDTDSLPYVTGGEEEEEEEEAKYVHYFLRSCFLFPATSNTPARAKEYNVVFSL